MCHVKSSQVTFILCCLFSSSSVWAAAAAAPVRFTKFIQTTYFIHVWLLHTLGWMCIHMNLNVLFRSRLYNWMSGKKFVDGEGKKKFQNSKSGRKKWWAQSSVDIVRDATNRWLWGNPGVVLMAPTASTGNGNTKIAILMSDVMNRTQPDFLVETAFNELCLDHEVMVLIAAVEIKATLPRFLPSKITLI